MSFLRFPINVYLIPIYITKNNRLLDPWHRIDLLLSKKVDKGLCVVVWDRLDYLSEAEKQFDDKIISKDVSFIEKTLRDLVEISNKISLNLIRNEILCVQL